MLNGGLLLLLLLHNGLNLFGVLRNLSLLLGIADGSLLSGKNTVNEFGRRKI